MYFFSSDDVCVKVMPLCVVTSVKVTLSDACVGTIARYAATAAAAHSTSRRGRGLAIIWALASGIEYLRRDLGLRLGHRGRAPCREAAQPVELGERFLLLRGVPERPVCLRRLVVGDVVVRIALDGRLQMRESVSGPTERDQRSPEADERLLEPWIVRHRLLEEAACRLELTRLSMHLAELVGGVRVRRIQGELFFERPPRFRHIGAGGVAVRTGEEDTPDPEVHAWPSRRGRQDLPVLAYRGVVEALALVRFPCRLVQPHGIGRDRGEPHRLQVGVVRQQPGGVIEHLRVVGVEARQAERDVDGVQIPAESRIGALQVESGHAPEHGVGGLREGFRQRGQGLFVLAQLR